MRDRIARGVMPPTNFATVVTDFTTCHNTWFCPGATRVFVPTPFCRNLAIENGMAPQQIIEHGAHGSDKRNARRPCMRLCM
jgi:1,2-diacylglycerol 3-beta-galactosyltransferase